MFKSYLKAFIPMSLKNIIINWNSISAKKEPISEELKRKLDDFFQKENLYLAKKLNGVLNINY